MDTAFSFKYKVDTDVTGFFELPGWENLTVIRLRKAIWEEEKKEFMSFGVLAASRLSLWKEGGEEGEEPLNLADNL